MTTLDAGVNGYRVLQAFAAWQAISARVQSRSYRQIPAAPELPVNCFVIMPFAAEFEDVYAAIQAAVEGARRENPLLCFRLDENRPAGRITTRLVEELQSASLCIADLTGARPNIMWEVGYAMALGKPTILVTQDAADLPFDIRDMETLRYQRDRLSSSLGTPLRRMVIDTVARIASSPEKAQGQSPNPELIGEMMTQIKELREIVSQSVKNWGPQAVGQATANQPGFDLKSLEGTWVNELSNSHLYARVVNDELVAPYCYSGNEQLNAVYYDWRRVGEFWFGRYLWLNRQYSGFTFLRQESVDHILGAWWEDKPDMPVPSAPDLRSGVSSSWKRVNLPVTDWAEDFFEEVRRKGILACLNRRLR